MSEVLCGCKGCARARQPLLDTIERVRELHKPIEYAGRLGIYNICRHCSELAEIAYKYPCDTIKALDGEK